MIQDQEEKELDDALGIGEESQYTKSLESVLRNPILIALLDEIMKKKNKGGEDEEVLQKQTKSESPKK